MHDPHSHDKDPLAHAYDVMMERVKHLLESAEEAGHNIEKALDHAYHRAIELDEMTREEAEKVRDYVRKDLEDMGDYIKQTQKDYRTWFQMDLQLIEARILDLMASIADQTKLELAELAARAKIVPLWQTGEVTGPGILRCENCGEKLHFKRSGRIPPCPKCHTTVFKRSRN